MRTATSTREPSQHPKEGWTRCRGKFGRNPGLFASPRRPSAQTQQPQGWFLRYRQPAVEPVIFIVGGLRGSCRGARQNANARLKSAGKGRPRWDPGTPVFHSFAPMPRFAEGNVVFQEQPGLGLGCLSRDQFCSLCLCLALVALACPPVSHDGVAAGPLDHRLTQI
jgi:hypothetical protein